MLVILFSFGFIFINKNTPIPDNVVIDKILVTKSSHQMEVFANNKLIKTYKIAFGRGGKGAKQYEGDKKTPEGTYTINSKNKDSGYHNNLGISYPNQFDIAQCKKNE